MRALTAISLPFLLLAPLAAQQVGDANRNYVINNQGSGGTSPSPVTVINCAYYSSMGNDYLTPDANAPVAWITATQGQIGWFTTATNSVDIGPGGLAVILDGTDPMNPIAPFLRTNANGDFQIGLAVPPGVYGTQRYFAMLHFAATSPDGFWLSQTHRVDFDPANTLGPTAYDCSTGTSLSLGDDQSLLVALGFTFEFYGGTYTQVYVGSNGYVTFGASDTSFTESGSAFASGVRKAAVWWDDLNPGSFGAVRYETTNSGPIINNVFTFRVCWDNVPEYLGNSGNFFSLSLRRSNPLIIGSQPDFDVIFDYAFFSSGDGLVGITPGNNIFFGPANQNEIDLSQGPNVLNASVLNCWFERFNFATNPIDLYGQRVTFDLDDDGYPQTQS